MVCTMFDFSSANEATLTMPTLAKPTVHLFNFIVPPISCLVMVFRFRCLDCALSRAKPVCPSHRGAIHRLPAKLRKRFFWLLLRKGASKFLYTSQNFSNSPNHCLSA